MSLSPREDVSRIRLSMQVVWDIKLPHDVDYKLKSASTLVDDGGLSTKAMEHGIDPSDVDVYKERGESKWRCRWCKDFTIYRNWPSFKTHLQTCKPDSDGSEAQTETCVEAVDYLLYYWTSDGKFHCPWCPDKSFEALKSGGPTRPFKKHISGPDKVCPNKPRPPTDTAPGA